MSNPHDAKQLFILGAPRSGTTFLASLLQKSRFGKPVESHFINKFYPALSEYGDLNVHANFDKLLRDVLKHRAVMQWKLTIDSTAFHEHLKSSGKITYASFVNELMLLRNKKYGLDCWGDKTPHYTNSIKVLNELFPDAAYLFIVRDGRDVALSLLQRQWGPNNVYCAAKYWNSFHRDSEVLDALESKGQMYKLRYEDLVDNTATKISEITEFLGESLTDDEIHKLASTTKKSSKYRWKTSIDDKQLLAFESEASQTLERLGYEVTNKSAKLSGLKQFAYRLHDKLIWFKFMFKANVIDSLKIKFFGKEPFNE